MKIYLAIFFSIFLIASSGHAAKSKSKKKLYKYLRKSFVQMDVSYNFWQEEIGTMFNGEGGVVNMRFEGLQIGLNYVKPSKGVRWVYTLGTFVNLGQARGQLSVDQELDKQNWMAFGVTPGILYRTGLSTEVGFRLPIGYRLDLFDLDPEIPLTLDGVDSFFYGISAVMIQRIKPRSAVIISVTHQQAWDATQWSLGFQYDFR